MISTQQAPSVTSNAAPHALPKVLLVDDDLQDLDYYEALLRRMGCDVLSCDSYSEAAARLRDEAPDFVVVSQGGPEFKGRTVLQRAIEVDRRLPTLVLARCPEIKWYLEAMQMGAVDYVEKSVPPADFGWIVATHLPQRASVP